jgi:anti-sigma factor RsiW
MTDQRDDHELDELLGAYALDAVNDDERRAVDQYLLVNPRARAEVEQHREVASLLAWTGTPAPEGLWDRIAASLEDAAPPPSGELAEVLALDGTAGRRRPTSARSRRSRWVATGAWLATAAAAAVIAVFVVNAVDDGGAPLEAALAEARSDSDSKVATLTSADGTAGGEVVIDENGHGFLVAEQLPSLPENRTWQLWGVVDGEAISLGILGHAPTIEPFTVDGPVTQVIITNEVAGGVITNGNPDGAYGGFVG